MRIAILATVAFLIPAAIPSSSWLTNFEEAKTAAKTGNKVILASFIGSDWCGYTAKLRSEVFSKPEFEQWAAQNVVLLEVDFPHNTPQDDEIKKQNKELAQQFGIREYPTILFLDAAGKQLGKLGREAGSPAKWIKLAEAQMKPNTEAEGGWMTDYKAALAKAKEEKKVILADFTGSDWCSWCIKLKNEVFSKPEFQEWAANNVVLLELDYPKRTPQSDELKKQNEGLAKEYHIASYPTVLFLDATGKKVGQSGYVAGGPSAWLAAAEKELGSKLKKKAKK